MLAILPLVLGPVFTNCYLAADTDSGAAVVIDPAWDGQTILEQAAQRNWRIGGIWCTHAHFDHFAAAAELVRAIEPAPLVALHAADRLYWDMGGGGSVFGYHVEPGPTPTLDLAQTGHLAVGGYDFSVRHAPGHSPGHCIFQCAAEQVLFSGDVIFRRSVGRTDLPGGDWEALERSIRTQVFTLPNETRILPGHGESTTVGEEKSHNPFVRG